MSLFEACYEGNVKLVKTLLANSEEPAADINWVIRVASARGHTKMVELLLQDGRIDPTTDSNAAIGYASLNGHVDIVALLLQDSRVDPTDYGNYAIKRAIFNGHIDIVSLLLQDGRVEITDDEIHIAKTDEIKDILIAYKYRVDGKEYCRLKNNIA
jgi:ankyrin repeat protein